MITEILKKGRTSAAAVKYNEDKAMIAEAEFIHGHKMDGRSSVRVYDTFEKIESDERIRNNVRNKSFHMAVNPGPEDGDYSEQDILFYIDEIMEGLGYADQPYAVYRHLDIDREHFHVVSTRIKPDGSCIDAKNDRWRVHKLQEEIAPKYGFVPGLGLKKKIGKVVDAPTCVKYGEKDWPLKVKAVMELAVKKYRFGTREEFEDILISYGVGVRRAEHKGISFDNYMVFVVNPDERTGKRKKRELCRPLSAMRDLKCDIYNDVAEALYINNVDEEKKLSNAYYDPEDAMYIREAFEKSDSIDCFVKVAKLLGYDSVIRESSEGITSVRLVDKKYNTILDITDGQVGISIEDIRKKDVPAKALSDDAVEAIAAQITPIDKRMVTVDTVQKKPEKAKNQEKESKQIK